MDGLYGCSLFSFLFYRVNPIYKKKNVLFLKTNNSNKILDLPVKNERKLECAHVGYNQVNNPLPYNTIHSNIVDMWVHRHSVVLKLTQ